MTTSSRFLVLVPVALGWLALTVLGGTWLGLDVARLDREAAIATALEDPALVAELREDALDAAFAALPEPAGALEALTRDLVDDSVAEAIASQPITAALVAAEVDHRLGLGHDAVALTNADAPAAARTLLDAAGIELSVEVLAERPAEGGLVAALETALLVVAGLTALVHLATARLLARSVAALAGCAGAVVGLAGLAVLTVAATNLGDPIRRAIATTVVSEEFFLVGLFALALVAGRAALAHLGRLPYGALSPSRFGFVGDDDGF